MKRGGVRRALIRVLLHNAESRLSNRNWQFNSEKLGNEIEPIQSQIPQTRKSDKPLQSSKFDTIPGLKQKLEGIFMPQKNLQQTAVYKKPKLRIDHRNSHQSMTNKSTTDLSLVKKTTYKTKEVQLGFNPTQRDALVRSSLPENPHKVADQKEKRVAREENKAEKPPQILKKAITSTRKMFKNKANVETAQFSSEDSFHKRRKPLKKHFESRDITTNKMCGRVILVKTPLISSVSN